MRKREIIPSVVFILTVVMLSLVWLVNITGYYATGYASKVGEVINGNHPVYALRNQSGDLQTFVFAFNGPQHYFIGPLLQDGQHIKTLKFSFWWRISKIQIGQLELAW